MMTLLAGIMVTLLLACIGKTPAPADTGTEPTDSADTADSADSADSVDTAPVPDADGDGFDAEAVGGTDCNDGNANVYPGAPEACDTID